MEREKEDKIYRKATAKVKQMKDFYDHFFTFCIVLPMIILADIYYTPDILWSIPAIIIWGIALVIQWLYVKDRIPFFNRKWEGKKIREIMEKEVQSSLKSNIMETDFDEKIRIEKAKKRVQEIKAFYINLSCYCLVMPLLIFINLRFTPDYLWFFWSMSGWGIGLMFHAMQAFNFTPFMNGMWEERKIRQYMEEDRKRYQQFKKE